MAQRERLVAAFKKFDADGADSLSKDELKSILTRPGGGAAMSDEDIGEFFELFDENEVTVRVLADRSVADWFVQGGRWAATSASSGAPRQPAATVVATRWTTTAAIAALPRRAHASKVEHQA